jgi:predicted CoA-binding protein
VTDARKVLERSRRIVLVDWPSRDVPDTLVRASFSVVVKNGPGPADYAAQELEDGQVVTRPGVARPSGADVVYAYRPMAELPRIVALAKELGAFAVWRQSGVRSDGTMDPTGCWVPEDEAKLARQIVESADLTYLQDAYIADVARTIRAA